MDNVDIISLAISIGLGVLSIGLAGFAIWLSLRFNDRSIDALESVKALSNKIRTMTEVSLTHQKDFSSKMLDSLLEQSQYGRPEPPIGESPDSLDEMIRERLEKAEATITRKVEASIRRLVQTEGVDAKRTQEAIDTITEEIGQLSSVAQEASAEAVLPITIMDRLARFQDHPAHYVLIAAILRSDATSLSDLKRVNDQYHIPDSYEEGIEHLIEGHLLEGDLDSFSLTEDNRAELTKWLDLNRPHIARLIEIYSAKSENVVEKQELVVAQKLSF